MKIKQCCDGCKHDKPEIRYEDLDTGDVFEFKYREGIFDGGLLLKVYNGSVGLNRESTWKEAGHNFNGCVVLLHPNATICGLEKWSKVSCQ